MSRRRHSGRRGRSGSPRTWQRTADRLAGYAVAILVVAVIVAVGVGTYQAWGPYGERSRDTPGVHRDYDENGQLQRLVYDAHGRHRPDTWSYFDRGRLLRTDVDQDGDGLVDTSYHYDADGNVTKTGFSTKHDGVIDAWRFESAEGALVKIEYSGNRDGRITRTEYYERDTIVRVADSHGDRARN